LEKQFNDSEFHQKNLNSESFETSVSKEERLSSDPVTKHFIDTVTSYEVSEKQQNEIKNTIYDEISTNLGTLRNEIPSVEHTVKGSVNVEDIQNSCKRVEDSVCDNDSVPNVAEPDKANKDSNNFDNKIVKTEM
jgi:hypothetical protein